MKAVSLFSCAGIGELLLDEVSVDVLVANEIIEKRAEIYKKLNPKTEVVIGDIKNDFIKKMIYKYSSDNPDLLIATPPCQGLSSIGKNKLIKDLNDDERNFLIFDIIEIAKTFDFKYILIENVPKYLDMFFPKNGRFYRMKELLEYEFSEDYEIKLDVFNMRDYGVPQSRPRSIIRIFKKGLSWSDPKKQDIIPLEKSIGNLPSLMPGEKSDLKWHYAKPLRSDLIKVLLNTPTGKSALKNEIYYPKNKRGEKVKGFHNTYKRMRWDLPAHARTTYNGSVSSHNNIHPGRKNKDGTYSDPRVLSLLETFIVSTIPQETNFPENISDNFLRELIGEGVPPKFICELIKPLNAN